jgi:hypothetical protein
MVCHLSYTVVSAPDRPTDWALPDQLVFSTVSALLRICGPIQNTRTELSRPLSISSPTSFKISRILVVRTSLTLQCRRSDISVAWVFLHTSYLLSTDSTVPSLLLSTTTRSTSHHGYSHIESTDHDYTVCFIFTYRAIVLIPPITVLSSAFILGGMYASSSQIWEGHAFYR